MPRVGALIYTISNHIEENRHQRFVALDTHSFTVTYMGAL